MMAVHSVLVAGHLCIDITPEFTSVPELVPGKLYEIGSAQLTLGGCVANTGLALAAAGIPTRVCARVGNDPLGEIARRLGDVRTTRAVGAASGQNPIPIIVPCHRVVGAHGELTGFGGGIDRKRWLLEHEGALLKLDG